VLPSTLTASSEQGTQGPQLDKARGKACGQDEYSDEKKQYLTIDERKQKTNTVCPSPFLPAVHLLQLVGLCSALVWIPLLCAAS
jgi:hypothetical protein